MIEEIDTRLPVRLPSDRPLKPSERAALYKAVTNAHSQACIPDRKKKDDPPTEAAEKSWAAWKLIREEYGWLFNRIHWDEEWACDEYILPSFCLPEARYLPRKLLTRKRYEIVRANELEHLPEWMTPQETEEDDNVPF